MRNELTSRYQAKDFIQTKEGLTFAVVEQGLEDGKVLCFLRYVLQKGVWQKLATEQANELLKTDYPQYLFYSEVKSAYLHAVPVASITTHYQPQQCLQAILAKHKPDQVEQDLFDLCQLFQAHGFSLHDLGVTGSILMSAQNSNSDIDLVVYGREKFHQLRELVRQLIAADKCQQLDKNAWLESYKRRLCDLNYTEYVWHEQRKYNKALINQRKFDLNLIEPQVEPRVVSYEKQGPIVIQALVADAQYAFDYPARFLLRHDKVVEIVCYTATYTGQAEQGETIEAAGQLEVSSSGQLRVLVGSTREAEGEYIKVIKLDESLN